MHVSLRIRTVRGQLSPTPPSAPARLRVGCAPSVSFFVQTTLQSAGHADCQENKLTSGPTAAQAHPVCAPPRTSAD
jgi:hypothetical protein